jgi:hypothetical protein
MTADVNTAAIQARATKIITDPKNEWPVIDAETTTVEKLYKGFIMPLAAIPAIAGFIGNSFVGTNMGLLGYYRMPIVSGLVGMIVGYVLALAMVYVAAMVIDKLAQNFQSQSSMIQALKLVAYSQTVMWVAGVANILPLLALLVSLIAGLYAIYTFYLGLPVMMKTPQDKVIPYMVVSAVVVFVLAFIVALITGAIVGTAHLTM